MNLKRQLDGAFLLSLCCAAGFVLAAILIGGDRTARFDGTIIAVVQGWESEALTRIMEFFTVLGNGLTVFLLTLLVLVLLSKVLRHRDELILFIGVVTGSYLLNSVLKQLFERPRPEIHRIVEAVGFSFPSGHSMSAFTFCGIVAFLLWRHISSSAGRAALVGAGCVWTLAIGVSRIYLGVHYPSDVLGGFLAGGSWLAASIWVFQRYKEKGFK